MGHILLRLGGYTTLVLVLIICVAPFIWMVMSSVKPNSQILSHPLSFDVGQVTLDNIRGAFQETGLVEGLFNTSRITITQVISQLIFCSMGGFALAKYDFRGKEWIFRIMLGSMMIPPLVVVIPLFIIMAKLHWVDTFQAVILPSAVTAFGIFWMRQAVAEVPDELLDAARIDGSGDFGLYWRIVLPIIVPSLTALGIFSFMTSYNDFLWPLMILRSPSKFTVQIILAILNFTTRHGWIDIWGLLVATSMIATVPIVLLFLFFQRFFIAGILAGSLKG
jgi:multiple sugar transport system permease protein